MGKSNRRGVMEKKRRDKINNCLNELKMLVPTAVSKEASEKLEKADIIQLTVDYLNSIGNERSVHESIDFREMGFRECLLDISRYLTDIEGLNYQDPFRLRLMSCLKCFSPDPSPLRDILLLALSNSFR